MLKIAAIKTNKGYYIAKAYDIETNYMWSGTVLSRYFYNGEKPKATFDPNWWWIPEYPIKIEERRHQPAINKRYELKDKDFVSGKLPKVISYNDAGYFDDDYDWHWNEKYKDYASLYEYKEDKQPDKLFELENEIEVIVELDIDEIDAPPQFNYTVQRTNWENDGTKVFKSDDVKHQIIDKIITPSILIHNKPCSLSSKQVYDILRQYIKENINHKVAKITSDYNFCFTVKKIIQLSDPIERQKEILTRIGRSYKHPKYQKIYVRSRDVEVFQMTHTESNYEGYTPIGGMIAENEYELKEMLDKLCTETIEMINEPLADCPHCKGMGVILEN